MSDSLRGFTLSIEIDKERNDNSREQNTAESESCAGVWDLESERSREGLANLRIRKEQPRTIYKLREHGELADRSDHTDREDTRPDRHCLDLNPIFQQINDRYREADKRDSVAERGDADVDRPPI